MGFCDYSLQPALILTTIQVTGLRPVHTTSSNPRYGAKGTGRRFFIRSVDFCDCCLKSVALVQMQHNVVGVELFQHLDGERRLKTRTNADRDVRHGASGLEQNVFVFSVACCPHGC